MASKQESFQVGNESVYELGGRFLLRSVLIIGTDVFDGEVYDGLIASPGFILKSIWKSC